MVITAHTNDAESLWIQTAWEVSFAAAGTKDQKKTALADARQQRLDALKERKARKDVSKQVSRHPDRLTSQGSLDESLGPADRLKPQGPADRDAAPSELPSRDTSSSDSARAGQNGARDGPDKPQGRPTQSLRHAGSAGATTKPAANAVEQARGRSDRESPKSGTNGGAVPKGNALRAAGPSRLGPGREGSRSELPNDADQRRLGKKRPLQVCHALQLLSGALCNNCT